MHEVHTCCGCRNLCCECCLPPLLPYLLFYCVCVCVCDESSCTWGGTAGVAPPTIPTLRCQNACWYFIYLPCTCMHAIVCMLAHTHACACTHCVRAIVCELAHTHACVLVCLCNVRLCNARTRMRARMACVRLCACSQHIDPRIARRRCFLGCSWSTTTTG